MASNNKGDQPNSALAPGAGRTRRRADPILDAFQNACDQGDIETAADLLDVLEFAVRRPNLSSGWERRSREGLITAHEWLWLLRHPEFPGGQRLRSGLGVRLKKLRYHYKRPNSSASGGEQPVQSGQ